MASINDWQRDIREGVRRENWSVGGPNRIVKVLPFGSLATALGGYITLGRFLTGKTPLQIEEALGLPHDYLKLGARIYSFTRLPLASECEYELTAKFPDGLAFNPAHGSEEYPPGSASIHQWQIKKGICIPVDTKRCLDLPPGRKFPYDWLVK